LNRPEPVNPKEVSIKDFTYELPPERIAKFPLRERDESKLLIYREGKITNSKFKNLPEHLAENSLAVFNNSKVVNARLFFHNKNGAKIEIFCLEPSDIKETQTAFQSKTSSKWKCFVGNLKAWKDEILRLFKNEFELNASIEKIEKEFVEIKFSWKPEELSFGEILEKAGVVPLPPYMKRDAVEKDKVTYQTIYASIDGSVAAPTAGLHFTENVLKNLKHKNIENEKITLHVGAGTFKPVKSETLERHDMHYETFLVKKSTIEKLLEHVDGNIIAVGTTSLRTIESLYWLGVQLIVRAKRYIPQGGKGKTMDEIIIGQWEPYEKQVSYQPKETLEKILEWMNENSLGYISSRTGLLIAPSYDFKFVNTLITNFHQPNSTLLLLVGAFVGSDWRKIYDYALQNDFRFLSYGDASLLFRKN